MKCKLTIQVEVHAGLRAGRAEARSRRVLGSRLCGRLDVEVDAKVNGRGEVDVGAAVDVEEVGVEEGREVVAGGLRLCERLGYRRQLVQVRNVLRHVGPARALVS